MPSLKAIRTRIASVKSTQKITRAMKMVAGARLTRAQQRITTMRPYAVKTKQVLAACTSQVRGTEENDSDALDVNEAPSHPLLVRRPEKNVLFIVLTSDRGLCGAFNANILRAVEREVHRREKELGQHVQLGLIGRKGEEYFKRRTVDIFKIFEGVWNDISLENARIIAKTIVEPFEQGKVDAIYLVYNEFKSAMSQKVVFDSLLPLDPEVLASEADDVPHPHRADDFIFEPSPRAVLERLVPMYIEITVLRAMLESNASEQGARMTAMDAATKNAKEMIDKLTLQYNRARQAAITKELLEIISGAEALKG